MDGFREAIKAAGKAANVTGAGEGGLSDVMRDTFKMLDELHKNDPEAYKSLLDSVAKEASMDQKSSGSAPTTAGYSIKCCVTGVAKNAPILVRPGLKSRAPLPSNLKTNDILHVNVCGVVGIGVPLTIGKETASEVEAKEKRVMSLEELLSLEIPLLIGEVHTPQNIAKTSGNQNVWAIDIALHPWVLDKIASHNVFKFEVSKFIMGCILEEVHITLKDQFEFNKSAYVGGSGPNGIIPLPFDISKLVDVPKKTAKSGELEVAAPTKITKDSLLSSKEVLKAFKSTEPQQAQSEADSIWEAVNSAKSKVNQSTLLASSVSQTSKSEKTEFFNYLASHVPEKARVYSKAVESFSFAKNEAGEDVFSIVFNPAEIQLSKEVIGGADLLISQESLSLSVCRSSLPNYDGLKTDMVLVFNHQFASSINSDLLAAKVKLKGNIVTIRLAVA